MKKKKEKLTKREKFVKHILKLSKKIHKDIKAGKVKSGTAADLIKDLES